MLTLLDHYLKNYYKIGDWYLLGIEREINKLNTPEQKLINLKLFNLTNIADILINSDNIHNKLIKHKIIKSINSDEIIIKEKNEQKNKSFEKIQRQMIVKKKVKWRIKLKLLKLYRIK